MRGVKVIAVVEEIEQQKEMKEKAKEEKKKLHQQRSESFIKCKDFFKEGEWGLDCIDCNKNRNLILGSKEENDVKEESDDGVDDQNKFLICNECSLLCHQHHSFNTVFTSGIKEKKCMCKSNHCKRKQK